MIFRAFIRGRSRPGAPLQQIWTCRRSGSSQESHPPHQTRPVSGAVQTNGPDRADDPVPLHVRGMCPARRRQRLWVTSRSTEPCRPGAHQVQALRPSSFSTARRIHEETDRSSASARSLTLWRTSGENLTGTGAESLLDRLRGGPCGTWLAAWAKKSYSCSAVAGSILMSILSAGNNRVGRTVLGASRPGEVEHTSRAPARHPPEPRLRGVGLPAGRRVTDAVPEPRPRGS